MCRKGIDPAVADYVQRLLMKNGIDREAGLFFTRIILFMVGDCANPRECTSALQWLETIGVKLMPILGLETEKLMADARANYEVAKAKASELSQQAKRKRPRKRKTYFAGTSHRRRVMNPSCRDSARVEAMRERVRYKLKNHTLIPQHAIGR